MKQNLIKLTETTYGYYLNVDNNTNDIIIDVVISKPNKEIEGKVRINELVKYMGESLL